MGSFRFGGMHLSDSWLLALHPTLRHMEWPPLPEIDCSQCRMVAAGCFHERTKCCNIYPELPNFLVGEILLKGQKEGSAERVVDWVEGGRTDPYFAFKPSVMHAKYDDANYEAHHEIPACPLLGQDGNCTIYGQRPQPCMEYNCTYPAFPEIVSFWFHFSSMLMLYTYLIPRYLLHVLDFDQARYQNAWEQLDASTIWSEKEGLAMNSQALDLLWQGKDKREFYIACYQYIQEHKTTFHKELADFRSQQLLQALASGGLLTPERAQEILDQPRQPNRLQPTPELWERISNGGRVESHENLWTLQENEGFLLWLHQAMMGRYALLAQQEERATSLSSE